MYLSTICEYKVGQNVSAGIMACCIIYLVSCLVFSGAFVLITSRHLNMLVQIRLASLVGVVSGLMLCVTGQLHHHTILIAVGALLTSLMGSSFLTSYLLSFF
jgi:hypothetical protein